MAEVKMTDLSADFGLESFLPKHPLVTTASLFFGFDYLEARH
jgi:hypothetical protein